MKDKVRDPVFWSDVTQLVKTVVAVSLAWVLAVELIGTPQSFLAPWAALLVVQATVFRTFSQGARQVAAAVAGVLLAWSAGNLIGPDVAALGAVVFLGLLLVRACSRERRPPLPPRHWWCSRPGSPTTSSSWSTGSSTPGSGSPSAWW